MPHGNVTLLDQIGDYAFCAFLAQFRVHRSTAGRVRIAHHFDDVSGEPFGGLRKPLDLCLILRRHLGATDSELHRGLALHVIFAQGRKALSVLLNVPEVLFDLLLVSGGILPVVLDVLRVGGQLHIVPRQLPAVSLERLDVSGDLLGSRLQTGLDHLGCLQVVPIDGNSLRYNATLFIGGPVNVHLESRDKNHIGHELLIQTKQTLVIFCFRVRSWTSRSTFLRCEQ